MAEDIPPPLNVDDHITILFIDLMQVGLYVSNTMLVSLAALVLLLLWFLTLFRSFLNWVILNCTGEDNCIFNHFVFWCL